MGVWSYTKDGLRTLSTCTNTMNTSKCDQDTIVFLTLFSCILAVFALLDVMPINDYNSSICTTSDHIRIFVKELFLCVVVSFFVADIGLDLVRTHIKLDNIIWHAAWLMPFVLCILSRMGSCLIHCLPEWARLHQTRAVHSGYHVSCTPKKSKIDQNKSTNNGRRKSNLSLPEEFGVQGSGKLREQAYIKREGSLSNVKRGGSRKSSTVLDNVASIDENYERWRRDGDHKNKSENVNIVVGGGSGGKNRISITTSSYYSCCICCWCVPHLFIYLRSISYRLHAFIRQMFNGTCWDLYESYSAIISIISVYIYLHGTYETSAYRSQIGVPNGVEGYHYIWREECPANTMDPWTHWPQEFIECSFFVDYILRLLVTNKTKFAEFSSIQMLCDLMSISMLPVWLIGFPPELLRSFGCLRCLRLLRIITHYGISSRLTKIQLRKWNVYIIVTSLFMVTAGLILTVEYSDDSGFVCFHDAVYFSVVSLLTVGLGDLAPISVTGRILSTFMLIVGVAVVSYQLNELEAANRRQAKFKYSGHVPISMEGHVIVCGEVMQIDSIQVFLHEFCHPNHCGVLNNRRLPTIIILCPNVPSTELEHLLELYTSGSHVGSGQSRQRINIQYMQGLPSSVRDLHRVGTSRAKSVFIIANSLAKEKDRDAVDMQVMLTTLAISKSSPKTTHVLAQVLLPESISTVRAAGAHVVVCESALKYSILANSYWSNGISAFISNLARSSDLDGSDYADGCDWEIYTVRFSSTCVGCTFDVVSRRLLKEDFPRPLLIGLIQHDRTPSRVVLNPPHHYIINGSDEAIVMAVDLKHAQKLLDLNVMIRDHTKMIQTNDTNEMNDEYYRKAKYRHHQRRIIDLKEKNLNRNSNDTKGLLEGKGGSSHSNVFTTTNRETIRKIKKVIQSGLIKSQQRRDINALSDCRDFKNHIVILGTIASAVNLLKHLCLCESDEDNKQLLPPVVVLTLSADKKEKTKLYHKHHHQKQQQQHRQMLTSSSSNGSNSIHRVRNNIGGSFGHSGSSINHDEAFDENIKYLNSVCAGLVHGILGSVEDLLHSGAPYASMVVLLSNRQIEMEEGYHTDGMSIRTTLLLRSACNKLKIEEPYIVTELFNSANTVFVDRTSWGGTNTKHNRSHYTLSPAFSEGKIYTNELNDTLLGMSYYVPRMAECLVQMIDGPSKLRHYIVPPMFLGKKYIEVSRYLQAHETIAVAVVSKGLAVGVEQRASDDVSLRTALTLWKMVVKKSCCGGGSKYNSDINGSNENIIDEKSSRKTGSFYKKRSWSRMELMSLSEDDFTDQKHQCVITSPPDTRVLIEGDKILVLRPYEFSPSNLHLGHLTSFSGGNSVNWRNNESTDSGNVRNVGNVGNVGSGGKNNEMKFGDKKGKEIEVSKAELKSGRKVSSYSYISNNEENIDAEEATIIEDLDDLTRLTENLYG